MKRRHLLEDTARVALGAVFLYAGAIKIGDPLDFAGAIAAYEILPFFGNVLLAVILPWVECLLGLLLISGWRARAGAGLAVLLMLVFIAALVSAQARGISADCGCFQVGEAGDPPPLWIALLRDVGLLLLAVAVWLTAARRPSS